MRFASFVAGCLVQAEKFDCGRLGTGGGERSLLG
jgi:hypothetical protein